MTRNLRDMWRAACLGIVVGLLPALCYIAATAGRTR